MLIEGWQASSLSRKTKVLEPVKNLINDSTLLRSPRERVTYYHIIFDESQIIGTHGDCSESFQPGAHSIRGVSDECRVE